MENKYLPFKQYNNLFDTFYKFIIIILFEFKKYDLKIKDIIIKNFISRSIVSLKSILELWQIYDFQNCWILFRCILERLFLLVDLQNNNSYEIFEKWSFKQQYDANNKVRSDQYFKEKIDDKLFKPTKKQKERYDLISSEKISWKRPKAEEIAKKMNLDFLYKYGYYYASAHIHPMATDGEEDFFRLLNLQERNYFPDQIVVIHNSFLITKLLIQEGLNNSSFLWNVIIYDFLDDILKYLENKDNRVLSILDDICKKYSSNLSKITDKN